MTTVAELNQKLESAAAEKDELEKRLSKVEREQAKNSRNSHKPPSSDGLGKRRQIRKPKKSTGRKRGGQPGHPGHYRPLMPVDAVDAVIDVFPEFCEVCQQTPPQKKCARPFRHQLFDLLPRGGGRHVTERRYHRYRCACGEWLSASREGMPTTCFGPRLSSVICSLTGKHHQSRREVVVLLDELFNVHIALGSISNIEGRMSEALEAPSNEAMQSVEAAGAKHVDETSWLRDSLRCSAWVVASSAVSVFRIVADGTRDSLRGVFKKQEGVLISDRATVFLYWPMGRRQICWAHLLRAFIGFSERDGPAATLGCELVKYAELVFIYWRQYQLDIIVRADFVRLMEAVRDAMKPCLQRAARAGIDEVSGSCSNMLDHWSAMWTFIGADGIDPTNNHAERELRRLVMWRKRCFGSQSERGDRFVERMMTVTHTARKQNLRSIDFLEQSYAAWLKNKPGPKLLKSGQ